MSISYEDSKYPIRKNFAAAHERFWQRLAHAGTWWTAEQRLSIAREVRQASACGTCRKIKAALSPNAISVAHERVTELNDVVVEVVHRITTDQSRLTEHWYHSVLDRGLTEGQYVEIVGTVAALVSIDSFCMAIGHPLNVLPEPIPGSASEYRPASAQESAAWVPLIPADANSGDEADLWSTGRTGYVIQAMSLVPDEVRTLSDLSAAHYLPNAKVMDPTARGEHLDRQQIELIAGRVSALNQCYY